MPALAFVVRAALLVVASLPTILGVASRYDILSIRDRKKKK